jgi:hypothetical protein
MGADRKKRPPVNEIRSWLQDMPEVFDELQEATAALVLGFGFPTALLN